MALDLSALPTSIHGVAYTLAGIIVAAVVISELSKSRKFHAIPTVGPSGWLGLWWTNRTYQTNAHELIQEGYEKYKHMPFKIVDCYRWIVIVSTRQHIEEARKAPDDALSFEEAVNDALKVDYTMGPEVIHNSYPTELIRSHLTRRLGSLYPEIRDELSIAFDEVLNLSDNEWKSVPVSSAMHKIVCRISNRVFVGLPLCRDPDWIDLNMRHTVDVVTGANIIRCFPHFLAPIVAYFMADLLSSMRRAVKHLTPVIEERLRLMEEYGSDWLGKPDDFLSWILEEAPEGPERSIRLWTTRILAINFSAIHTSSSSFSHALFFLAENPQYVLPLREEVEGIVEKEGWSKSSLEKMYKIDSFLKESQRMIGLSALSLLRLAIKDFTFSDGTFIPKGTVVAAAAGPLHHDDEHYENPYVFNPFRFSDMRSEGGEDTKHHFVSTSTEFLTFGHGKHACPGRFFAASELKSMLAHIVVSYDVKLEDGKARPTAMRNGPAVYANPTAKVMFRRRVY